MSISADGNKFAVAAKNLIKVWSLTEGRVTATFEADADEVELVVRAASSCEFYTDPDLVAQIVRNLVSNALGAVNRCI